MYPAPNAVRGGTFRLLSSRNCLTMLIAFFHARILHTRKSTASQALLFVMAAPRMKTIAFANVFVCIPTIMPRAKSLARAR